MSDQDNVNNYPPCVLCKKRNFRWNDEKRLICKECGIAVEVWLL